MPIRTKDGDGFSAEERKRIDAAKRDLPAGKLPIPKAPWERGGGSSASRSKKQVAALPAAGGHLDVVRPSGETAADGPLTPEFPLQVFVRQAVWLEDRRRAWGFKSRSETIRRIISEAMGGGGS